MRKMRWNCKTDGCFNDAHRLRLGEFDECFPGKIGFTDVDGIVEVNGRFLWMEWKRNGTALPTGQRIMFERLTGASDDHKVIVVHGDPSTMTVQAIRIIANGLIHATCEMGFEGLCRWVHSWCEWARSDAG